MPQLPNKEPLLNSKRRGDSDFNFRKEKYLYGIGEKAYSGQFSKIKRNHLQEHAIHQEAEKISTHCCVANSWRSNVVATHKNGEGN